LISASRKHARSVELTVDRRGRIKSSRQTPESPTGVMHRSDFRGDDCRHDVHGKHTPSDRPYLGATGYGPKQETTVRQVPEDQRTFARAMGTGKAGKLARHVEAARLVLGVRRARRSAAAPSTCTCGEVVWSIAAWRMTRCRHRSALAPGRAVNRIAGVLFEAIGRHGTARIQALHAQAVVLKNSV
jgi:hypothetical protein